MKRGWLGLGLLVLLVGSGVAGAQALPEGVPRPGKPLRDRDFGVSTRQFGLEREVEMYQWRASDAGYQLVWNNARIDSSRFGPGYENPPTVPLDSRRWWAETATLDGRPIDAEVLRRLGSWRRFRPDFSRLPANLAASFQPEGDGLGSSENPLSPRVGDLRVHWRELVLPALGNKIELRDGAWRLTREAALVPAPVEPLIDITDVPELPAREWGPLLAATIAALAGLLLLLRRRRKRRSA